jgi:hypothetical protein
MIIIGADYHPGFQQIAFVDTDTGELQERRLEHRQDAEKFYRDLAAQELKVRVGMEASGQLSREILKSVRSNLFNCGLR